MKRLLIGLVAMVCLLGMVGVAYGNSGSAIIPSFMTTYTSSTQYVNTLLRITNITNEPIDVKISLFQINGSLLSGTKYVASYDNVNNLNTSLTDATVSFSIDPNSTCQIIFNTLTSSSITYGYGRIEWYQGSKASVGLVVFGYNTYKDSMGYDRAVLPINNGLPF